MRSLAARFTLVYVILTGVQVGADDQPAPQVIRADVIIAGGSTAALAAAFAAAEEGATTVRIEPTDWMGGQLTTVFGLRGEP